MTTLPERIAAVRARVDAAARAAGRRPEDVRLIGVTKTHPVEVAVAAVAAGLTDLGENRTSELVAKAAAVPDVRWHLVGRLQRNKVRDVVGHDWLLHGVDRPALVEAIAARAEALGAVQDVLLQVNVAGDPAKAGCDLTDLEGLLTYAAGRAGLRVVGLMTVPPLPPPGQDPGAAAAPWFARLRGARDALRERFPGLEELSMGMSDDLEAAVGEGATMVRIGTALFGAREVTGA
ncbi:MAG: YggS family pyridoxal phosphate-dependent enzyme [Nitriliruptoraceae bacterium]